MPNANQSTTRIILNLDPIDVHQEKLTYAQLVHFAYPQDPPADTTDFIYTITISHPDLGDLSLARGDKPVPVKEGMVCHVRKTGRS
ncbi:multiubiquitin domain-containing protein [Cupriavidus consociatus]|uniref:multiubiquitin domain-containing protein n=1 Tax=Cupriavidus consociatus TaxID=2821357 RepID=UPI001AE56012|nr:MULTISPECIES: multiubiquitin domain-containing protein [unclassified Cupriavidus]MBP0624904.1 multiubiquitin domain-containing protein [Cupriavidus sp. LEh25]MDK2661633.1 multiubiquitin domain-containing protein [Cupriavidus sp. LEh21]